MLRRYTFLFPFLLLLFPALCFSQDVLNINGKNLVPGQDYIVHSVSGKGRGSFDALTISNHFKHSPSDIKGFLIYAHKKGQVVVFDYDKLSPKDIKLFQSLKQQELSKDQQPAGLVFVENKKLQMDGAGKQFNYPVFSALRSALPAHIAQVAFDVSAKQEKDRPSQK